MPGCTRRRGLQRQLQFVQRSGSSWMPLGHCWSGLPIVGSVHLTARTDGASRPPTWRSPARQQKRAQAMLARIPAGSAMAGFRDRR